MIVVGPFQKKCLFYSIYSILFYILRLEWKRMISWLKYATKCHSGIPINILTLLPLCCFSHWDKILHRHGLLHSPKFQRALQSLLLPISSVLCSPQVLTEFSESRDGHNAVDGIDTTAVCAGLFVTQLKPTCVFGWKSCILKNASHQNFAKERRWRVGWGSGLQMFTW